MFIHISSRLQNHHQHMRYLHTRHPKQWKRCVASFATSPKTSRAVYGSFVQMLVSSRFSRSGWMRIVRWLMHMHARVRSRRGFGAYILKLQRLSSTLSLSIWRESHPATLHSRKGVTHGDYA